MPRPKKIDANFDTRLQLRLELARKDFWEFCKLLAPDFYKDDRPYLKDICNQMQAFAENPDERVMVINCPPRHGKSRTAQLFTAWNFGRKPSEKVITGSYNEQLSTSFSRAVRDLITERKAGSRIVYSDIFPAVTIKRGSSAANMWTITGQHISYLATSPNGTVTGFGASCFPAGTVISTKNGPIPIENFYNENEQKVLTYNHERGTIEEKPVEVVRRKTTHELVKVVTEAGTFYCTPDHHVYTANRGYVRADNLGRTDVLVAYPQDLRSMWPTDGRQRNAVLGLLERNSAQNSGANLFVLRESVHSSSVCSDETREAWRDPIFLFENLFLPVQGKGTAERKSPEGSEEPPEVRGHCVSDMRENVSTAQWFDPILLGRLCEQIPFSAYDGFGELALQGWPCVQENISRLKAIYLRPRQSHLPMVRSERNVQNDIRWQNTNKSNCTPFRPQQTKQQHGESFDCVCQLPREASPTIEVKLLYTETVPESCYVYDIQVADNHNFFANGFLVHNCMIIDDIIRNADEAYNETVLQNIWEWFTNTMMSRLEAGGKLIVIATRWHSDDLSGHIMRHYENIGVPVRKIILRALQADGTMLCPEILDRPSYDILVKTMGRDIVEANYNNQPVDMVGRLYQQWFKEYSHIPKDEEGNALFEGIYSYCDTADQGNDFLCNIIYGWYDNDAYVLDVYYTDENMIDTEPETAKRLHKYHVDKAYIESNSGGRGFGRSIERILREKYHTTKPFIELFYQNKNKGARILGGATWVQEHVIFPSGWRNKWPDFFNALYKYQKEIKGNKHDDAPDALTGIYDKMGRPNLFSFE